METVLKRMNVRNQVRIWVTTGKKGPKKRNFPGYRQKCPLKNWNATEGLESYERNEQQVMVNASLGSNGSAVKLGQGEGGQVSSEDFLKPSNWQINGRANGNLEKQMERNLSLRNWRGNVVVLLRFMIIFMLMGYFITTKTVDAFRLVKANEMWYSLMRGL